MREKWWLEFGHKIKIGDQIKINWDQLECQGDVYGVPNGIYTIKRIDKCEWENDGDCRGCPGYLTFEETSYYDSFVRQGCFSYGKNGHPIESIIVTNKRTGKHIEKNAKSVCKPKSIYSRQIRWRRK